jgi:hypothetical protein
MCGRLANRPSICRSRPGQCGCGSWGWMRRGPRWPEKRAECRSSWMWNAQRLARVEPGQEADAKKVREHIQRVMERTGAHELRTDELSVYEHTAASEHMVCLAHWLESKCKRAWELARLFEAEKMSYEAQAMRQLIELLHRHRSCPMFPEAIERWVRRFINSHGGMMG